MNKAKILNKLIEYGFYLAKADSSKEKLIEFINLLKPIDIGLPLIRIGSLNDGGYLVPDDLEGITTLLSPGVSTNSDFEYEFAERGIKCFLADFSVNKPAMEHSNFFFFKKFISSKSDDEGKFLSLNDFFHLAQTNMLENGYLLDELDYVLSMDIEGDEIDVLLNISDDVLDKFRIIVIELHGLQRVFHEPLLVLYKSLINKLLKRFCICHIHPNNGFIPVTYNGVDIPPLLEITFINRKRLNLNKITFAQLPHKLDNKTVLKNPEVVLSSWYY
jgi:hypothetical protein